ncbi:MAG TPA: elongation factor P [Candidatus Nanoarchaeia archaeon]|nr:elongation factor P [uncultured archaeon]
MINVTDLRSGTTFQEGGNLFEVLDYSHTKMGRGTATIKIKVRNLRSGATTDKSFISGARVEEADLTKKEGQFLYRDASGPTFMDKSSFEQFSVPNNVLAGAEKFLKEGQSYQLLTFGDQVLKVEIPRTADLKVVESPPGARGDTVANAYKAAVLENDMKIQVPLFIKEGEVIKVDTRSGEYMERVKS